MNEEQKQILWKNLEEAEQNPLSFPPREVIWAYRMIERVDGVWRNMNDAYKYLDSHKKEYFMWIVSNQLCLQNQDIVRGFGRWFMELGPLEKKKHHITNNLEKIYWKEIRSPQGGCVAKVST